VARPVRQIGIHGNWFEFCDRSGIGVQRASYEVTVTGNLFTHIIDQAIDFEPTGTGSVGDYTITGNVFTTGANAQGAFEVAIAGIGGTDLAFRVVFAHNVLKGRGLLLFNVRRAVIEGNVIEAPVSMGEAVLTVEKLDISFAPYAARGRACSGSSGFSARVGVNRGMGKIPASCRASRQAHTTSS
jgi:hypothetical protein